MGYFRPHSASWVNRRVKEGEALEKEVTLPSLESQYKRFCQYAHNPAFRIELFRTWGWRAYKHG